MNEEKEKKEEEKKSNGYKYWGWNEAHRSVDKLLFNLHLPKIKK